MCCQYHWRCSDVIRFEGSKGFENVVECAGTTIRKGIDALEGVSREPGVYAGDSIGSKVTDVLVKGNSMAVSVKIVAVGVMSTDEEVADDV